MFYKFRFKIRNWKSKRIWKHYGAFVLTGKWAEKYGKLWGKEKQAILNRGLP